MTGFNVDEELRRLNTMCSILWKKKRIIAGWFSICVEGD
jgi:hypothetical protein